jgi:hypothetical protein
MWNVGRVGVITFACGLSVFAGCDLPEYKGGGGGGDDRMEDGELKPFQIEGRVCHAVDLRFPNQCGNAILKGVEVRERDSDFKALGNERGEFLMATRGGKSTVLEIAFANPEAIPSVATVKLDKDNKAENVVVPLVDPKRWIKVQNVNDALWREGTAAMLVHVVRSIDPKTRKPFSSPQPVAGVTLSAPPGIGNDAYYNAGDQLTWSTTGKTSKTGAALFYNIEVPFGTTELFVVGAGELSPFEKALLPVAEGAVSMVTIDISEREFPELF